MHRSRRRTNGSAIRGPQSALTDFLASHNISAQQINLDYQQRVRNAEQQAAQEAAAVAAEEEQESSNEEDAAERKKRKRKEEKAIAKLKESKEFKKRKFEHHRNNPDLSSDDDAIARDMISKPKAAPLKPGQLANCELCEKRFTVTPYTIAGPDGGLLCMKCGKQVKDQNKKDETAAKKKKPAPKLRKRQTESDRMMGDVKPGAKSLIEHCVKKVADVVTDVEDFGELPQNLLDRLSQILSKRRVLNSRTLQLFLQPGIDRINVYDCAKLESEDFNRIFAFMPDLETVNLRFAGQLKDEQLGYMVEKCPKIKHLQLGATNLVSDDSWINLFQQRGAQLESLKLSELNDAMKDDTVQVMTEQCTNLKRLKMRSCPHMSEASIYSIATMTSLEHLTLSVARETAAPALVNLIINLGPKLKTLCLEGYSDADDEVLLAIKQSCTQLQKLRLTGGEGFSDAQFANLFWEDWSNPPMSYVDLSENRDMDQDIGPDEEAAEDPQAAGFASNALKALFQHSGSTLQRVDLHSNRHISSEALMDVFDGQKQYPALTDMDLSFVTHVDDIVMNGIFKSCPALQKLACFACFSVNQQDLIIPKGIAVIGLPNAQTAVEVVGTEPVPRLMANL